MMFQPYVDGKMGAKSSDESSVKVSNFLLVQF